MLQLQLNRDYITAWRNTGAASCALELRGNKLLGESSVHLRLVRLHQEAHHLVVC